MEKSINYIIQAENTNRFIFYDLLQNVESRSNRTITPWLSFAVVSCNLKGMCGFVIQLVPVVKM